jgi:hypothetical protein
MPETTISVEIHTVSRLQRCVNVVSDDSEHTRIQKNLPPGVELHILPLSALGTGTANIDALIAQATGIPGPTVSANCAVVDATGRVVALWKADPSITIEPGYIIVQSDQAKLGDTFANGQFSIRPDPLAPIQTVLLVPAIVSPNQPTTATGVGAPFSAAVQVGSA